MARRRNKQKKSTFKLTKVKITILSAIVALFVLLAGVFVKMAASTPEVFTIASTGDKGSIEIQVVELRKNKITKLLVSKDTEVELAMHRGTLRAQSVVKLIDTENLSGQLLADTVMRTFYLPIDYWEVHTETDLPLFVAIQLRILKLRGFQEEVIDLSETSFLGKTKLGDGDEGYKVTQAPPLFLVSLFADANFAERQTTVGLVNATGEGQQSLDEMIKVFETLGVKVAPISNTQEKDVNCIVSSVNEKILDRVATVFNCDKSLEAPKAFDIEIILGREFYNRF